MNRINFITNESCDRRAVTADDYCHFGKYENRNPVSAAARDACLITGARNQNKSRIKDPGRSQKEEQARRAEHEAPGRSLSRRLSLSLMALARQG
ncbi:hypothetical protein EVAR_80422_1 [Eumeta japonica]|uniref:Uncharacterized protein n=1 Tax=Eumeta variegata TaxID=151549 RepID=A0A4C1VG73_EUMVA|nr:hypothetical protein EVAR_80422_1 [Eumeta japonica]